MPDVADSGGGIGREADFLPSDGDGGRGLGAVEERDGAGAVVEFAGPDLGVAIIADLAALFAEGVLVDGDGLGVGEEGEGLGIEVADVASGDERRGEDAPEGELGAVLLEGEVRVAGHEHVGVVPLAWAGGLFDADLAVEDLGDAEALFWGGHIPGVEDIGGGAPEVADGAAPAPWLVFAPLADVEDDGPAGRAQGIAHRGVGGAGILAAVVAPVVFEVVDAPAGVLPRVLELVAAAAGAPLAGPVAGAGIDAEFHPERMGVVGEGLDAGGKARGIRQDVALGVARDLPAIVDDDVGVPGGAHAVGGHGARGLEDDPLVDVAAEVAPGIPAHGRRSGETVIDGQAGMGGGQERGQRERGKKRVAAGHSGYLFPGCYLPARSLKGLKILTPGRRKSFSLPVTIVNP